MHELPFVMRLLAETDEIARENRMDRIRRIRVEVGALSGIVPECVSLYFESASEGHAAEGAELEFTEDPAILRNAGGNSRMNPDRRMSQEEIPLTARSAAAQGSW